MTQAQLEAQKATQDFQRATEVLRAAKETISLAEQRLLEDDKRQFDSAWQEMLNHATQRVGVRAVGARGGCAWSARASGSRRLCAHEQVGGIVPGDPCPSDPDDPLLLVRSVSKQSKQTARHVA